MKTLIIDNYDSFTYNIYQLSAQINSQLPTVITNDQLTWQQIEQGNFDNIIISPGPGNPKKEKDFGICREVLLKSQVPVLGICLGHQGLGYYYGSKVINSPEPFHGRLSQVFHDRHPLFKSIPSPFKVVRYHSLVLAYPLGKDIEIIAQTKDNLIMAIAHKYKPFWGVQFHPESIASEYGQQLLLNFNALTKQYWQSQQRLLSTTKKTIIQRIETRDKTRQNLQKEKPKKLKIYSQKLNLFCDSALVFELIYSQSKTSFWLDSSMVADGLSRFSYMGDCQGDNSFLVKYQVDTQTITKVKNEKITTQTGDIFSYLQQYLDQYIYEQDQLPFNFNGGFVGYFGYELKSLCGTNNQHHSTVPDAQFIFVEKMIVFDHHQQDIYLVFVGDLYQEKKTIAWFQELEKKLKNIQSKIINYPQKNCSKKDFCLSRNKQQYLQDINTCLQQIKAGESYEICLTNQLFLPTVEKPLQLYQQLRNINPAPYSAFFKLGNFAIVCSSPERFLRLEKNGEIESKPIKGTVKRSSNHQEDQQLRNNLKCSQKEQAENLMIVDLLRNDLGQICQIGSVKVPKLMAIETYSTVHQMVSTVRGKIKPEITPVDCIRACFPGGSMTGAPKKRTMEIIDQLETEARGIYSGSIGFLALNGTMDLNIVIRTAIITPEKTSIGIGGAITALSQPESEFAETILKAQALIEIIDQ